MGNLSTLSREFVAKRSKFTEGKIIKDSLSATLKAQETNNMCRYIKVGKGYFVEDRERIIMFHHNGHKRIQDDIHLYDLSRVNKFLSRHKEIMKEYLEGINDMGVYNTLKDYTHSKSVVDFIQEVYNRHKEMSIEFVKELWEGLDKSLYDEAKEYNRTETFVNVKMRQLGYEVDDYSDESFKKLRRNYRDFYMDYVESGIFNDLYY